MARVLCAGVLTAMLGAMAPASADTGLRPLTGRADLMGWEAVGRLDIAGGGYCTGVLIAPDLVLTAAHCLHARDGTRTDPRRLTFRAGLRDGTAIATAAGRRAVLHPGYLPGESTTVDALRADAALVQLAVPIPAAVAAPFAAGRPVAAGGTVSVVSYAQGRSETLSWQPGCTVRDRAPGLYAFSCDVWFGSSGAPVFESGSGRARIVSIISRGWRETDDSIAYGPDASAVLADLKTALRVGRGVFPETDVAPRRVTGSAAHDETGARFVRP